MKIKVVLLVTFVCVVPTAVFADSSFDSGIQTEKGVGGLSEDAYTRLAKQYIQKEDFARAFPYALKANQNDPFIRGSLGLMYMTGVGTGKNFDLGTNCLASAFEMGHVASGLALAKYVYIPNGKIDKAREILVRAAELKDAMACRMLGDICSGETPPRVEEAGKWYERAVKSCENPSTDEFEAYGRWLYICKPYTLETIKILAKADADHNPNAQMILAKMYASGGEDYVADPRTAISYYKKIVDNDKSTPFQYAEAVSYLHFAVVAATTGMDESRKLLEQLFASERDIGKKNRAFIATMLASGYLEGVDKNISNAEKWAYKAMEYGSWDGLAQCGQYYEQTGDKNKAYDCYVNAATNGSSMGMGYLARTYLGMSGKQYAEASRKWAWAAIKKGLKDSGDSELISMARELATQPVGMAYVTLATLEKNAGNEDVALKLILEGVQKAPTSPFVATGIIDYIREGRIKANDIDLRTFVPIMRACAPGDLSGWMDVVLAQYLYAHPKLVEANDEVEQLYNRAAGKGNSCAILRVYGERSKKNDLTDEEKNNLHKLLLSARKINKFDEHYERVKMQLKMGAESGWWKYAENEEAGAVDSSDEVVLFGEAAMLMEKGMHYIENNDGRTYFTEAKKKLQSIDKPSYQVAPYLPVYMAICDLMSGEDAQHAEATLNRYVEKGNLQAIMYLFVAYCAGVNVEQNLPRARELIDQLEKSAKEKEGLGVGERLVTPEKIKQMRMSVDMAEKQGRKISRNFKDTETGKFVARLERLAEAGDAKGELGLSMICRSGLPGFPADTKRADTLFNRAIKHANVVDLEACADGCYTGGPHGRIPKDLPRALLLYKLAADKGSASAANNLAIMYENAEGCSKDMEAAFKYFLIAAQKGCVEAQISVGNHYEFYRKEKDSLRQALTWYKKAKENGSKDADGCIIRVQKAMR